MPDRASRKLIRFLGVGALLLAGCAANPPQQNQAPSPEDPWESLNRSIYKGNTKLDNISLKPLAKGYRAVLPGFVRTGIDNFFVNLRNPWEGINNLLQGKGLASLEVAGRFLANSTIGLGGLFDVATGMGLERHEEDLGQTLAVWGVPDGPYVMVPFFGPQTLRDALALPVDLFADPLVYYDNSSVRDKLYILRIINLRERYLDAERLLEDSFDPYVRLREAYLQNRRYEIYDGNPPVDDDFYDEFEEDFMDEETTDEDTGQ